MLEARTSGEAHRIVQGTNIVQTELGPNEALQTAWERLDNRFTPLQEPSDQLVHQLTSGPEITRMNAETLDQFAQNCQNAVLLMNPNNRPLNILNEKSTLMAITNRLDHSLRARWFEQRKKHLKNNDEITFKLFTEWTSAQAQISLELRQSDSNKTNPLIPNNPSNRAYQTPFQTQRTNPTTYNSSTGNSRTYNQPTGNWARGGSRSNTFVPSRTYNNSNNTTRPNKSFNDTKNHTNNLEPQLDSSGKYPATNGQAFLSSTQAGTHTLENQSHDTHDFGNTTAIPSYNKTKGCWWCRDQFPDQRTDHRLQDCFRFGRCSTNERTNFIVNNNICTYCLNKGHAINECTWVETNAKTCSMCGYLHHRALECPNLPDKNITQG